MPRKAFAENSERTPFAAWLRAAMVACLVVCGASAIADEPAAVAPEQIAQWIAELDSDDFAVREAATRALVAAGKPVAKPLAAAATAGSLELGVRAVTVLTKQYTGSDESVVEAAEQALEQLASSENRSIAARAAAVFDVNYTVVQRRAVIKLEQLGGIVKYFQPEAVAGTVVPLADEDAEEKRVEFVIIGSDWKGGDEGLKHVIRLGMVPMIYLVNGSGVTEQAAGKLMAAIPNLRIEQRGPAHLGVRMEAIEPICRIADVSPGASAAKAGMQPGDVVLSFGGQKITTSESLIDQIGKYQPGDKVQAIIDRNGAIVELEVVMGTWKGN